MCRTGAPGASPAPSAADAYDVRGRLRLTWLELVIVVVTLAVGTTVAGADLASRRIRANEASAVATLRMIGVAQERFKAVRVVDPDTDGIGEFGVFRELSGAIWPRTSWDGTNYGGRPLAEPPLPSEFGLLNSNASVRRSGYYFKMFLPSYDGGYGVEEQASGVLDSLDGSLIGDLAESTWCYYAWPIRRGRSGRRTFFLHQDGLITMTTAEAYRRRGSVDEWNAGAAFVAGEGASGSITGTQALGTVGRDGNLWTIVE